MAHQRRVLPVVGFTAAFLLATATAASAHIEPDVSAIPAGAPATVGSTSNMAAATNLTSTNSSSPPSPGCTGFNEDRLHGHCHYTPPAEFEAAFYAAQQADPAGLESNSQSLHQTQGDSPGHATEVLVAEYRGLRILGP